MRKAWILLCLSFLLSSNLRAHEYWFEPQSFFLEPGESTTVRLLVGDGLIKDQEERPFERKKTPMFGVFWRGTTVDLAGSLTDGTMPIYQFAGETPGNYLLAMERNWSYITLEGDSFEEYLRTDGMEYILDERKRYKETGRPARERYSRYIKSLMQVGDSQDATFGRKLGLTLELVPLSNPYSKKIGDTITFQVLFKGKPLRSRTVFADNRESETQKMTTDAQGRYSFKLGKPGLWLTRMVIMERCRVNCEGADWNSYWAAFSFGVK